MTPVTALVAAARAEVEELDPGQVAAELDDGFALLVAVREPDETAQGVIPGAVLAPRGMLEFHADAGTPYHLAGFEPARRVILYCAAGSRSALAARSLRELGFRDVAHLGGGFASWVEEGRPVTRTG